MATQLARHGDDEHHDPLFAALDMDNTPIVMDAAVDAMWGGLGL